MDTAQPEDVSESICKDQFQHMNCFLWPRHFGILDHSILTDIIALRFYLAAHNQWKAVSGLTSNVYENWRRNLPALGYFIGTYDPYDIGLLAVNHSGVDTMEVSITALYYCYLSHYPANLYIFLCYQEICVRTKYCYLMFDPYK